MKKLIRQNEKGVTMIETLIATALIVFISTSAMSLFIAGYKYNAISEQIVTATNIARARVEFIRNTEFSNITNFFPAGYSVTLEELPSGECYVTYPDGVGVDPLNVLVCVDWTERGTPHSVKLSTLITNTNL